MTFLTELWAKCAADGELKHYAGDNIDALSFKDAQKWCDENKPYLKVIGILTATGFKNEKGEWVIVDHDAERNN